MYLNLDSDDFSTRGLYAEAIAGWKINTDNSDNNFGYFMGKIGLEDKLTSSGSLIFQTVAGGRLIFEDSYYFYYSSFLGGNNGLRGYRNEHFSGKYCFYDKGCQF